MSENNFIKVTMGTSNNRQFKMMLPPDLVQKLDELAKKTGKKTGQEVVMELIDIYLPVWSSLNLSLNRAIDYQIKIIEEEKTSKNKKGVPIGSIDITQKTQIKKKTG